MAAKTRQYRFKQKIGHIQLKNKLATVGKKRKKLVRCKWWGSSFGYRSWVVVAGHQTDYTDMDCRTTAHVPYVPRTVSFLACGAAGRPGSGMVLRRLRQITSQRVLHFFHLLHGIFGNKRNNSAFRCTSHMCKYHKYHPPDLKYDKYKFSL